MTNTTAANGKEAAYHGVPAEEVYGYAQAIKIGNTIHVSGQLSQDDKGAMIAPAALDDSGKPADFSMMAEQMRVTYANAAKILAQFGATLDHVVDRVSAERGCEASRGDFGRRLHVLVSGRLAARQGRVSQADGAAGDDEQACGRGRC